MAYCIKTHSLGTAHDQIVKQIVMTGLFLDTEDNEATIELPHPCLIHVHNPFAPEMVSRYSPYGKRFMERYVHQLVDGEGDADFAYTYHDRLFHHKACACHNMMEVDQFDKVAEKLISSPNTRRAQMITWYPYKDLDAKEPPCLQRVQFLIRKDSLGNKALNMHVDFRSQDMLMGFGANVYALAHLQSAMAQKVNLRVGWYSHQTTSAHIYYKRDANYLEAFAKGLGFTERYNEVMRGEPAPMVTRFI